MLSTAQGEGCFKDSMWILELMQNDKGQIESCATQEG